MQNFKALKVWQRSHQLALVTYTATMQFPKEEPYGLTSPLRRSVTSIPTNIAEGSGRNSSAEFARFLSIAMGLAAETEYQLLLARELGIMSDINYDALFSEVVEIRRMWHALMQRVSGAKTNNSSLMTNNSKERNV